MHSKSWIAVAVLALSVVACQAPPAMQARSASAASCSQDVVDAWNSACAAFSFHPCPGDAGDMSRTESVGSMYFGTSFEVECTLLMIAIQGRLLSSGYVRPDEDDFLSAVINDPVWYQ